MKKKDIITIEQIQRRATKFMLDDYHSDYRLRLSRLSLLPVMFGMELQNISLFVKCLKNPSSHFNIYDYMSLSRSSSRFGSNNRLKHKYCKLSAIVTFSSIELYVPGIVSHH